MLKFGRLLLILAGVLVLAACGGGDDHGVEFNKSDKVANLEAVNQDGEVFNLDSYHGKWSVVDFIFTKCSTVCIPMSHNMSRLQDDVAEAGLEDVQFISYSIDPEYDTPEILKEYATAYNADTESWHFLTGYEFDEVKELAIKSFKTLVQEPEPGSDQVGHQTWFSLVNPEGQSVKVYSGGPDADMDVILEDLKNLTK